MRVAGRGGLCFVLSVVLVIVTAALKGAGSNPLAAAATPCGAVAAAEPQAGHTMPPAAPALFATDFPKLMDCEWGYPLGGWGGVQRHAALKHTPVIFVHGNQADAENWYLVADQFKQLAGYTDQEMYAISYNGLENGYAGLPARSGPAPESIAYWQMTNPPYYSTPGYAFCCNGGHGASDDPNVPDLYNFVRTVQQYTGASHIEIVAHSLGVTITRKMLLLHPELRPMVLAAVMIAGANHGTTVCRGLEQTYYGCDEIAPGTRWLAQLNAAGETPGPTKWMVVCNCSDSSDPFFQYYPGLFDDRLSPELKGAINLHFPTYYHNDLRVDPAIVPSYLKFLLQYGDVAATSSNSGSSQAPAAPLELPNTSR